MIIINIRREDLQNETVALGMTCLDLSETRTVSLYSAAIHFDLIAPKTELRRTIARKWKEIKSDQLLTVPLKELIALFETASFVADAEDWICNIVMEVVARDIASGALEAPHLKELDELMGCLRPLHVSFECWSKHFSTRRPPKGRTHSVLV